MSETSPSKTPQPPPKTPQLKTINQAPLYVYAHDFALWAHQAAMRAPADVQTTGLPSDIAARLDEALHQGRGAL